MDRTTPILVFADETGELYRHYEDCPVCNGHHTVKVHVASFATWCYEEKTCQSCSYFDKLLFVILHQKWRHHFNVTASINYFIFNLLVCSLIILQIFSISLSSSVSLSLVTDISSLIRLFGLT